MSEFAFLAFQMGAGGDKTFGDYLNSIGLGDKTQTQKAETSPRDIAALQRLSKEKS